MLIKKTFVTIFFIVILMPFLLAPIYNANISIENRNSIKLPNYKELSLIEFTKQLKSFLESEFAFRDVLIKAYLLLKEDILQTESIPHSVKHGKNGWYFLGNFYQSVYNESLGIINHDNVDINNVCSNILSMNEICIGRKIDFYCAIVENKHQIYKEMLPLVPVNTISRFEKVNQKFERDGSFRLIKLSRDFLESKQTNKLYYKTDSHWTGYGALLGAKVLLDSLQIKYNVQNQLCKLENYEVDSIIDKSMDLSKIIYKSIPEYRYQFKPLLDSLKFQEKEGIYYSKIAPNKLKVLVFHDSYFLEMRKFLAPHFKEMICFWSEFDIKIIDKVKPDIVIFIRVERNMKSMETEKSFLN